METLNSCFDYKLLKETEKTLSEIYDAKLSKISTNFENNHYPYLLQEDLKHGAITSEVEVLLEQLTELQSYNTDLGTIYHSVSTSVDAYQKAEGINDNFLEKLQNIMSAGLLVSDENLKVIADKIKAGEINEKTMATSKNDFLENIDPETNAKLSALAESQVDGENDENSDKKDPSTDTGNSNIPGNTSGTGGYSLYSGTGAITTATAFSTVNQARVENTTSNSNKKPSETPIEDNKEEPSTGDNTNNDNNTEKPNDGDNNTEDNNTGDNNKPSEGGNNNQVVPPTNNNNGNNSNNSNNTNNSNNNPSTSRPGTPVGGNNNTGSSYRPSGNNNHYATSNNDQITPPTTEDGTNISETTPSAPESDTNISSSAGEELDVISIDRGNNKTSSASASSNDGGNVVPTILGVGVAAGAAVAGAKYIKDKKEKDNTYEDNIGEEDAFSYLGDYEGDLSDENAPKSTKYKAGNVNKLVLDDSDGEVKIEDNYQEPTEQKEELE